MESRIQTDGHIDEFIDLNKLATVLYRSLPLAFIGLVLGLIIGVIFVFTLPKRYQAAALVEIIPTPLQKVLDPLEGLQKVEEQGKKIQATVSDKTYETLVLTPRILSKTRQKLLDKGIVSSGISFKAKMIDQTQLLNLIAQGKETQNVALAADTWTDAVIEEFANQGVEFYEKSSAFILDQYQKSRKEIDVIEAKIKAIKPQLEIKETELNAKKSQLLGSIEELTKIEPQVQTLQLELPVLKEEIKKHERIRPMIKTRDSDNQALVQAHDVNLFSEAKTGGVRLIAYEANPIYADLEKKISDFEVQLGTLVPKKDQLTNLLKKLTSEVDALQKFVNAKTLAINEQERDLGIAKKSYDFVYSRLSDVQMASSLRIAGLRVVSYSGDPRVVGTKMQVILVFPFLGFLIAMVAAYFYSINSQHADLQRGFPFSKAGSILLGGLPRARQSEAREIR